MVMCPPRPSIDQGWDQGSRPSSSSTPKRYQILPNRVTLWKSTSYGVVATRNKEFKHFFVRPDHLKSLQSPKRFALSFCNRTLSFRSFLSPMQWWLSPYQDSKKAQGMHALCLKQRRRLESLGSRRWQHKNVSKVCKLWVWRRLPSSSCEEYGAQEHKTCPSHTLRRLLLLVHLHVVRAV